LNKQRLEAFSDGVYAIVITLLILDVRIPQVQASALGAALIGMLPQIFTYVLSFFVVGLYWFSNHRVSHQVKKLDGTLIWLNLVWLLFVSVMPFPTSLLGRYPLQVIPITIYGADLILTNMTGLVITVYLKRYSELTEAPISSQTLWRLVPVYVISNGTYIIAIGISWIFPLGSYLLYALILGWLMVRYARITNPFQPGKAK